MVKKDSAHILITLPAQILKLLDKKRSSNKYFVYTRSEYVKNLILEDIKK